MGEEGEEVEVGRAGARASQSVPRGGGAWRLEGGRVAGTKSLTCHVGAEEGGREGGREEGREGSVSGKAGEREVKKGGGREGGGYLGEEGHAPEGLERGAVLRLTLWRWWGDEMGRKPSLSSMAGSSSLPPSLPPSLQPDLQHGANQVLGRV
jgi:hypothetical protein